jgi:hypothetical protein
MKDQNDTLTDDFFNDLLDNNDLKKYFKCKETKLSLIKKEPSFPKARVFGGRKLWHISDIRDYAKNKTTE